MIIQVSSCPAFLDIKYDSAFDSYSLPALKGKGSEAGRGNYKTCCFTRSMLKDV